MLAHGRTPLSHTYSTCAAAAALWVLPLFARKNLSSSSRQLRTELLRKRPPGFNRIHFGCARSELISSGRREMSTTPRVRCPVIFQFGLIPRNGARVSPQNICTEVLATPADGDTEGETSHVNQCHPRRVPESGSDDRSTQQGCRAIAVCTTRATARHRHHQRRRQVAADTSCGWHERDNRERGKQQVFCVR